MALSVSTLWLLTSGCFVLDLFDFDKEDGSGCPPDRVDSVCTPIPDGGPADAGPDIPCPYLDGNYAVSGCPATACTVTQEPTDCFATVTCETSLGALMSDTFIEENGYFNVRASAGQCQLIGRDDGTISGSCTDFIGIDSCDFVGTRR